MTDSDGTVIIIPPPEPEPIIIPDLEPVAEAVADAIESVSMDERFLAHEGRIAALETLLPTHTHPEYETQDVTPIAEPIIDDTPPAPPEPEEITTPEPVEDSAPRSNHLLFARPFGGS